MKHLIFVSVAAGIFSGTPVASQAQKTASSPRAKDAVAELKQIKFIESIEIRPENTVSVQAQPAVKQEAKKTVPEERAERFIAEDAALIERCSSLQFKYAQLLNVEVEAISNLALYQFIEKWWATPYRYGGATMDGVDCSAYSSTLIHDTYGIVIPRTARSQYDECEKVKRKDLQEGDLVFFRTRRGVSHVGVYLGNGYFTHASTSSGVMISNLDEEYYSKRYIGAGRIPAKTTGE